MQFQTLAEALYMAGHGPYVWAAYAISFTVILALVLMPVRRSRRVLEQQRRRLAHEQRGAASAARPS